MKCPICHRKFRDGERVIPVAKYTTTEKRGDFVSSVMGGNTEHIHLSHLKELLK